MSLIEVKNLVKKYKIIEKEDGLRGYLKNLIKPNSNNRRLPSVKVKKIIKNRYMYFKNIACFK